MRALIVDDSRAMRAILKQSLPPGCETFDAGHGGDALVRLDEVGVVDFALVDWNMPVMNGLDFVRNVRSNPAMAGMKIMMVTTETEVDHIVAALEAGANEYMVKPFTRDALIEKLALMGIGT